MDHVVVCWKSLFYKRAAFSALDKACNNAEYLFKGALFSVTAAFSVKPRQTAHGQANPRFDILLGHLFTRASVIVV